MERKVNDGLTSKQTNNTSAIKKFRNGQTSKQTNTPGLKPSAPPVPPPKSK